MKFHNYVSLFEMSRAAGSMATGMRADEFYNQLIGVETRSDIVALLIVQRDWYREVRPYYKVWPSIHEALLRVKLDVSVRSAAIELGLSFAIRLHKEIVIDWGWNATTTGYDLSAIGSLLVCTCRDAGGNPKLIISGQGVDYLATSLSDTGPMHFNLDDTRTFDDVLEDSTDKWSESSRVSIKPMLRLVLGVLLMSQDPSIVTADVLSKDSRKYEETNDPKYIERARKRGIVGWSIGEKYESCPHIRRPHFGIRHTGKGRTIPRIVPIKGAVVHQKKLTTVPTGYITPTGVEVEPT